MKLALTQQNGLHVLSVDGPIDLHQSKILKVGLLKLFKDGKNRIMLNLVKCPKIDVEVPRILAELSLAARELAGDIVIVSTAEPVTSMIANFSKPNPIKCVKDPAAAVAALMPPPEPEDTAPGAPAPISAASDPGDALSKKNEELKALKEQLKAKETGELSELKKKNAELAALNKELEQRLIEMMLQRRAPTDETAYQEKVKSLETRLQQMTDKVQELED